MVSYLDTLRDLDACLIEAIHQANMDSVIDTMSSIQSAISNIDTDTIRKLCPTYMMLYDSLRHEVKPFKTMTIDDTIVYMYNAPSDNDIVVGIDPSKDEFTMPVLYSRMVLKNESRDFMKAVKKHVDVSDFIICNLHIAKLLVGCILTTVGQTMASDNFVHANKSMKYFQ